MWDWNKLSPISGLSLPIEGSQRSTGGRLNGLPRTRDVGARDGRWSTLGSPWLTVCVLHRVASLPSWCSSLTEALAVLRDRAQQISVSLMELPGGRGGTDWEALYPLGLGLLICVHQLGCILDSRNRVWWVLVSVFW